MPSINNFFGTVSKTKGKIFYQENLGRNLKLIISQQYMWRGNDCVVFEAGICSELHNSTNGIQYYYDASELCCDSQEHIDELASLSNNYIQYPVYKFEEKPIEGVEFKSASGITIKRFIEMVHKHKDITTWKYVWRCEIGLQKMLELIRK